MNQAAHESIGDGPQYHPSAGDILRRSFDVLKRHPRLIIFPVLAILVCSCMFSVFASGFHPTPSVQLRRPSVMVTAIAVGNERAHAFLSFRKNPRPLTLVGYYLALMFWATFFNVAFYQEVMRVYAGERPSIIRGLRFACGRIAPIFCWSLFASSVGLIMRLLGDRFGWTARIAGRFGAFAWNVAAVFAIPVLVKEGILDPTIVLRHSSATVRKTWGELVYGFVNLDLWPAIVWGIGFICIVIMGGVIAKITGVALIGDCVRTLAIVASLCFVTALITVISIYRCALYIYATEGVVPTPFLPQDMDAGWKIRDK